MSLVLKSQVTDGELKNTVRFHHFLFSEFFDMYNHVSILITSTLQLRVLNNYLSLIGYKFLKPYLPTITSTCVLMPKTGLFATLD